MLARLRWLKVVSFMAIAFGVLIVGELGQAIAESFLAHEEQQMTDLLNEHRVRHDRKRLPTSPALRMLARRQAQRMVAAGFIYHNPDLEQEAEEAVPGWLTIGENVGVGPSPSSVFEAFLDSEPHHFNIDLRDYNILAIGAMAGDNGRMFFTQNFATHSSGKRLREKEAKRRKAERRAARRAEQQQPSPEPSQSPEATPEPSPSASPSPGTSGSQSADGSLLAGARASRVPARRDRARSRPLRPLLRPRPAASACCPRSSGCSVARRRTWGAASASSRSGADAPSGVGTLA